MTIYDLLSIILTLTALMGYINARYLKLHTTIAIMMGSLILSLAILIIGQFGFTHIEHDFYEQFARLNFQDLLMQGMLSFLLFAGALQVNFQSLKQCKWEIGVLAFFGTITSALIIAALGYYLLPFLGFLLPFSYCLLFGALISPTDPIAVLAIFKQLKVGKSLHSTVAGESLFNDGVGIVLFITVFHFIFHNTSITWQAITLLFLRQSVGGIVYGFILGGIGLWLIKPIDDYKVEILITIAMATGGYTLANYLGLSGPLAMVTAGIIIGNKGRAITMSKKTRRNLDNFWELIDEILNVILFFLIGLELLFVTRGSTHILLLAVFAIPIVLLARFITVAIPIKCLMLRKEYSAHFIKILVWGGLRGGLAVALALSLPDSAYRPVLLTMTYAVVIFSILVQGSTIKPLVELSRREQSPSQQPLS